MSEFVARTITITKDQFEFIKAHRSLNLSGIVQESLDDLIKRFENKKGSSAAKPSEQPHSKEARLSNC